MPCFLCFFNVFFIEYLLGLSDDTTITLLWHDIYYCNKQ